MKLKTISLTALSLTLCTLVMATEYKSPPADFKETSPPGEVSKVAEFNDDYKVEEAVKTDRGIASEKESEREPSSIVPGEPKKEEDEKTEDKVDPKPWLYNTKIDSIKDHEF